MKRTEQKTLRLTERELKQIDRYVSQRGLQVSEFVRNAVFGAMDKCPTCGGKSKVNSNPPKIDLSKKLDHPDAADLRKCINEFLAAYSTEEVAAALLVEGALHISYMRPGISTGEIEDVFSSVLGYLSKS